MFTQYLSTPSHCRCETASEIFAVTKTHGALFVRLMNTYSSPGLFFWRIHPEFSIAFVHSIQGALKYSQFALPLSTPSMQVDNRATLVQAGCGLNPVFCRRHFITVPASGLSLSLLGIKTK